MPRPGTKGGILKYKYDGDYYRVLLYKDGVGKQFLVHRILMETFVPNPLKKEQVNHIDGDKTNNDLNNLEWVTKSENQLHAYATGLQKVNVTEAHKVRHEQTKRKVRNGGASATTRQPKSRQNGSRCKNVRSAEK